MALSTENSVKAKVYGEVPLKEGEANEELEPGQGAVQGNGGIDAAGDGSKTTRVVREQRNPGSRGIEDSTSPLQKTYASGSNVEMLVFRSGEEARLLLAYADTAGDGSDDTYDQGAEVGWNASGYLEVNPTEAIGRIAQEDSITMSSTDDPTHVLVEFY